MSVPLKTNGAPKLALAFVVLFGLFTLTIGLGDVAPIAVLYPNIREPYQGVFLKIISGIEEGIKAPVKRYPVDEAESLSTIESQLAREPPKAIIALGRGGLVAAEKLGNKWPIVVGAVLGTANSNTQNFSGITLEPDPDILFHWLNTLTPAVKRVTVVYNQKHGAQSMARAREAAKAHGLALNALPAENLRVAAGLYRNFLNESAASSEALWLLQDETTLDENALLPVILKEAWDKNLVVFSSTPDHVKKGALFSLYPDNVGMGRSLAALALEQAAQAKSRTMQPLRDLLVAVNLRTAEHLGLRLPSHERHKFDMVFPSP